MQLIARDYFLITIPYPLSDAARSYIIAKGCIKVI